MQCHSPSVSIPYCPLNFDTPYGSSRVGGVGVDVKGNGTVHILIPLVLGQIIRHTIHALYTHDMTSRSAHQIGHLLSAC
jgi:hypothetical protein